MVRVRYADPTLGNRVWATFLRRWTRVDFSQLNPTRPIRYWTQPNPFDPPPGLTQPMSISGPMTAAASLATAMMRGIGADFHRRMVATAPGEKLLLGKITKTAATRAALFDSNMHQIVCRLRPRSDWGSLQLSPRRPSWIKKANF